MAKMIVIESETYLFCSADIPKENMAAVLRRRAHGCRDVAKQMLAEAEAEVARGEDQAADSSVLVHNEELIRSAIYDVGAVLLEELQGITAILKKHKLGGLHPTECPPTM